jgi:hypothetical protein
VFDGDCVFCVEYVDVPVVIFQDDRGEFCVVPHPLFPCIDPCADFPAQIAAVFPNGISVDPAMLPCGNE